MSPRVVEYAVNAVGSIEAFETVQATARLPGVVERVRFREGERVAAGAILVEIEPQRYRLAVEAARAALEKASAAEADARGRPRAAGEGGGGHPGADPRRGDRELAHAPADRPGRGGREEGRPGPGRAEPARGLRARTGGRGSSRPAGCRPGNTPSRARCWPPWSGASPCSCASTCRPAEAAELRPRQTCRFRLRDDRQAYEAIITHVGHAADPASRMVTITAEVTGADRGGPAPGRLRRGGGPHRRRAGRAGAAPDRRAPHRARLRGLRRRGERRPRAGA